MGKHVHIKGFNGLWRKGMADSCPPDHLITCENCMFPGTSQVTPRNGINYFTTLLKQPGSIPTKVVSFHPYSVPVTGYVGFMWLDDDGWLYDGGGNALDQWAGATDFTAINIYGRTYVCPKKDGQAYPSGYLYYFDGTNWSLAGGGVVPSTPAMILTQTTSGVVTAGVHNVAVSFQTRTGYITQPGAFASIPSDGTHAIDITTIPIGPTGTVARVLMMSLSNQEEYYFVPGGTIPNNTTTTAIIDSPDTALIASADYLLDIIQFPKAASALKFYKGRLVMIGVDGTPDNILISNVVDPETFNQIENVVNIPHDFDIASSNTGLVLNDVLYVLKPNATYATQDNGGVPGTWPVTIVDSGIGGFEDGVSTYSSAFSAQDVFDSSIVANKRGLMLFNGTYQQVPITYKVEDLWSTLSAHTFYKVGIAHDVANKRIYMLLPSTPISTILMGDYQEGLTPQAIKWSNWIFPTTIVKIKTAPGVYGLVQAGVGYTLVMSNGLDGGIYFIDLTFTKDHQIISPAIIDASIATYLAPIEEGVVSVYISIGLRITGVGNINIGFAGQKLSGTTTGFNLTSYSGSYGGGDLTRQINFTDEKMSVNVYTNPTTGNNWRLERITIEGNPRWRMRPSATQSA